jgi:hypothetical protein
LEYGDVTHYRVYSVGEHGHFMSAVDLVCPDDETAIESAKLLVDRYDIELWQGGRKVIRLAAQKRLCAAVTNWAMERRRGAGAGGVKTVQWLG